MEAATQAAQPNQRNQTHTYRWAYFRAFTFHTHTHICKYNTQECTKSTTNTQTREQYFRMHIYFVSLLPVSSLPPEVIIEMRWKCMTPRAAPNKRMSCVYRCDAYRSRSHIFPMVIAWSYLFVCVGCFELMKPIVNRLPLTGSVLALYNNQTCIIYHFAALVPSWQRTYVKFLK